MSRLNIALIGPGLVGKEFAKQIQAFKSDALNLKIVGIMSSSGMQLDESGISEYSPNQLSDVDKFINFAKSQSPCVVVDSTSNQSIADIYPRILSEKLHLVTPNKKGFSSSLAHYNSIIQKAVENKVFALHESTVGAGLPILSTLKDLIQTGDEIVKIEGIFSGTLSYIFNSYSSLGSPSTLSFSEIVKQAKDLGYTEPDPRDDLNGLDVARKVVILGRLAGLGLELDTLDVQNIVPEALRSIPDPENFMAQIPSYDSYFAGLNAEALAENSVLRYVGLVDAKGSSVKLVKYPASHPFASLKGSDNIIAFTTKRFPNPLIIQGAGAGAAVTAFGMFSDVLKIAKSVYGPF